MRGSLELRLKYYPLLKQREKGVGKPILVVGSILVGPFSIDYGLYYLKSSLRCWRLPNFEMETSFIDTNFSLKRVISTIVFRASVCL
jgi:hypothetical protein